LPFLRDRIRRIVPLYWLATAFWIVLTRLRDGAFGYTPEDLALSLLFLPNGPAGEGRHYFPVLIVGWTLNYEMLFYAMVAAALLLPLRWRMWALTGAFAALVTIGQVLEPTSAPLEFWTNMLVLHFLAGAWLATAFKAGSTAVMRGVASAAVVGIVALVPPAAVAVLLVAGGVFLERRGLVPKTRLLLLGDASYSLYLFHLPTVAVCAALAFRFEWPAFALGAAAIGASLAAGLLAYWVVERPLQRALRRRSGVGNTHGAVE
jgi:exopolysaccharide production protein ExoZ